MARIELIEDEPPAPSPPPSRRRPRRDASERTARTAVGGGLVSSMKRGMRVDRNSSWRLVLLATAALALLVILNWTWLARIHGRVAAVGGWRVVGDNARRWVVERLQPAEPVPRVRVGATGAPRDEV